MSDTLVDNVSADFCKAVYVCLARAEVAALYGVVEKPINAVAVVLVVLGGIDTALCRDRVRAAGAVLVAEALYIIPLLCKARRSGILESKFMIFPFLNYFLASGLSDIETLHLAALLAFRKS